MRKAEGRERKVEVRKGGEKRRRMESERKGEEEGDVEA